MDERLRTRDIETGIALEPSRAEVLWPLAIPLAIWLAGETIWGSSSLLTAPPFWAYLVFIVVGIVYFFGWTKLVEENHRSRNEIWDTLLWGNLSIVLILPALFMPYCLRLGIEIASFSFFEAPISYNELLIVRASGRKAWGDWLQVQFTDETGRDPSVRVTRQLHEQYRHISTLNRDCLLMPTQMGRWGVVRVLRATFWDTPIDVNRVRQNCANPDKIIVF
jgi:hypothetical protein